MVKTRSQASDETKNAALLVGTVAVSQVGTSSGSSSTAPPKRPAKKPSTGKGDTEKVSNLDKQSREASVPPQGTQTRERMKWTKAMNETVMRAYYECTQLETDRTGYRGKLYEIQRKIPGNERKGTENSGPKEDN